jgi:hypothetical protein
VKQLQANKIRRQNRDVAKKYLMDQSVVALGEKGKKSIITVNAKGCSLVPSLNQWLSKTTYFDLIRFGKINKLSFRGKVRKGEG